jgi:hypothetical protein
MSDARSARPDPFTGTGPGAPVHVGWKLFCGLMMLATGIMNLIFSILAISDASYFESVTGHNVELPAVNSLTTYGWVGLVISFAMLVASVAVFWGQVWARVVGVVAMGINAVFQMAFLPAFPLASVTVILLNVAVIYGLVVHGERIGFAGGEVYDTWRQRPRGGATSGRGG